MIRYSIIIPHRGSPELLRRAVGSIPPREDVQVIVEEDPEGRGAGYARNLGLEKVQGKWVLFLDSDDFFVDGFLSMLDRHFGDDADIVFFDVCSVYSGSLQPSARTVEKSACLARYAGRQELIDFYCRYLYPEPWGKMVRADFLRQAGIRFDETVCANDYAFSVRCGLAAKKTVYDSDVLYCVTEREGSVSSSYFDDPAKTAARLDVYWRVQQLFDGAGVPLYPFPGMWMMCRREGGETFRQAQAFVRERGISPWRVRLGCLRRIIRKRLRMGAPYCR